MNTQDKIAALNEVLNYAKTSPFYSTRIQNLPLHSLEDIKNIPFTTKSDLREQSPFGLLPTSSSSLSQYHESSGTTGTPVSVWYNEKDLDEITSGIASCGASFNESDIVLIRFPYALSTISHFVHRAVQRQGGCVVPADSRTTITPMSKVIDLVKRLNVTVLACISLQAIMLAEVAEMLGLNPKRDFPSLRAICTAGEPLTPFRRKLIEEIWGVPVFDNYGMTEVGTTMVDCSSQRLHVFEDYFHVEVLADDLKTDVKDGEIGNLVLTTLRKRATPMIRYVTGDLVQVVEHPCSCGRNRSFVIRGRKENLITVDRMSFDMHELEKMISPLPARRFWSAGKINSHLYIFIEKETKDDQVLGDYVDRLKEKYGVALSIILLDRGALYDRSDDLSFGMVAKPHYFLSTQETENLLKMSRSEGAN